MTVRCHRRLLMVLFAVVVVVSGCSSSGETTQKAPTAQPVTRPTLGPEPTAPPAPPPTPVSTATPVPATAVPGPTPVPPCGTRESGPTLEDHCATLAIDFGLACVVSPTTYFDVNGRQSTVAIDEQRLFLWTGLVYELDDGSKFAEVFEAEASADVDSNVRGFVDQANLVLGYCPDRAGPADDFATQPCLSAPVVQTIGSQDSTATRIQGVSTHREPGCVRYVFTLTSSALLFPEFVPSQLAPQVSVAASATRTEISLPTEFSAGPFDKEPAIVDGVLILEDINQEGTRRLQLTHEPAEVRVQVLDGPARLVIDVAWSGSTDQRVPAIVGENVILRGPIDPTSQGFTAGDTLTIRGWVRPRSGARPFIRALALQESSEQLDRYRDGLIPFLSLGAPIAAADGAELAPGWSAFVVDIDTTGWVGASHAILIGDDGGPDGFLGSGQIVQITDENGERQENYDFVPGEVLIDRDPSSWVMQG